MNWKYAISFIGLWFGLNVQAQVTQNQSSPQRYTAIGVDAWGTSILPFYGVLKGNGYRYGRPTLNLVLNRNKYNFFDFSIGYEGRKDKRYDEETINYTSNGFFAKLGLGFRLRRKLNALYYGFGLTFWYAQEQTTAVLKGSYFGDYSQKLSQKHGYAALNFKVGVDIPINAKLSIRPEINPSLGAVASTDSIMPTYTASGMGRNLAKAETFSFSCPMMVYLSFKL